MKSVFFSKSVFHQWFSYNLLVFLNCYYYDYVYHLVLYLYSVATKSLTSTFQCFRPMMAILSSLVFFFFFLNVILLQYSSMGKLIHYQHNLDTVVQCSVYLSVLTCRKLFILSSKCQIFSCFANPRTNNLMPL